VIEVLQLLANGIQNQMIVLMRSQGQQKVRYEFAEELVRSRFVIGVITNITST
jgi:hypothetical protein